MSMIRSKTWVMMPESMICPSSSISRDASMTIRR
jgi:hypothetical protein